MRYLPALLIAALTLVCAHAQDTPPPQTKEPPLACEHPRFSKNPDKLFAKSGEEDWIEVAQYDDVAVAIAAIHARLKALEPKAKGGCACCKDCACKSCKK